MLQISMQSSVYPILMCANSFIFFIFSSIWWKYMLNIAHSINNSIWPSWSRLTNENTAVKILPLKTQFDLVTFRLTNENIAIKILLAKTQFDLVTFRLTNENTAAKILPVSLIMTIRKEREMIVNSPGWMVRSSYIRG